VLSFQLLGKYMMFRSPGVSNVDNANLFFEWLKTKGISSHRQDIVEAVALKVTATSNRLLRTGTMRDQL
jgi:hypothetical protein